MMVILPLVKQQRNAINRISSSRFMIACNR